MDALATLARLARRAIDEERRTLAALNERRRALLERIEGLGREATREAEAATGLSGGPMLLSSYLAARRERERSLRAELEQLERQRLAQLDRIAEKRLEARRLERLGERRKAAAKHVAHQREMRALDDLITARATRRGAS